MINFEGKTALITGASKGLGLGVARAYAEAGADLVLNARGAADLEQARSELSMHGGVVDVADLARPVASICARDATELHAMARWLTDTRLESPFGEDLRQE